MKKRMVAFFSYARLDDEAAKGLLSKIRKELESEIRAHTGDEGLEVFQDVVSIEFGDQFMDRIHLALDESAFFIPILTPYYFKRPACRDEIEAWFAHDKAKAGRTRILPIKFLGLPKAGPEDPIRARLDSVIWADFRKYRRNASVRGKLSEEITKLAEVIAERWQPSSSEKAAPGGGADPSRGARSSESHFWGASAHPPLGGTVL